MVIQKLYSRNVQYWLKKRNGKLNTYGEFEKVFQIILNKHAPIKTQMLGHNNNPFITKDLRIEIIKNLNWKIVLTKNETMPISAKINLKETTVYSS